MSILVSGATGNVGALVFNQLIAEGHDVRGGGRNPATSGLPAANAVRFDLDEPGTFREALAGVSKLFLYAKGDKLDELLEAALAAGKPHIVMLSSCSVMLPGERTAAYAARHVIKEEKIIASGLPYTFLRPSDYPMNTYRNLDWAKTIRAEGTVHSIYLDSQVTPIHERDIADCAVAALTSDKHIGSGPMITGPAVVSPRDQVAAIGRALGRTIVIEEITREQAVERLLKGGLDAASIDRQLTWWKMRMTDPTPVTHDVERMTGKPARTIDQWARDHIADFS